MTSQLTVNKIAGLTSGSGAHTVNIETGGSNRLTVSNTTVTIPGAAAVTGALTASDTLAVTNNLTVTKNIIASANLTTSGTTSLQNLTVSGTTTGVSTITTSSDVSPSGGAAADFTGLPSGIKRLFVNFYGVSGSGSDVAALIRLGKSDGFVSSGYGSTTHWGGGGTSDSTGLAIYGTETTNSINGTVVINHMGGNIFVSSHSIRYNNSNGAFGGGYVSLGGTLDRLTVRLVSGGNFDSGTINVMYET